MKTSIYTLTSELHDEQSVNAVTQEFLNSLDISYDFKADDYSDYGTAPLSLIYVRTGGTEGIFRRLLPQLPNAHHPIYLLTSGKSNSLAASMEILSYLRQQQLQGRLFTARQLTSAAASTCSRKLPRHAGNCKAAAWASSVNRQTGSFPATLTPLW